MIPKSIKRALNIKSDLHKDKILGSLINYEFGAIFAGQIQNNFVNTNQTKTFSSFS